MKLLFSLFKKSEFLSSLEKGFEGGDFETRDFPDGEIYLRLKSDVKNKECVIVADFLNPGKNVLRALFLSRLLKEEGASRVSLLVPYLPYMRQDKKFNEGEPVTSKYFAELISPFIDELVTIDPHLHRWNSLDEIYKVKSKVIHSESAIASYLSSTVKSPLLIGPDSESKQWVSAAAKRINAPYLILEKKRLGDRKVEISFPGIEKYMDHTPVLVDDIVSTGNTMIQTILQLKKNHSVAPVCLCVHAIFTGEAYQDIKNAGAKIIVSCNHIIHESNSIDLAPLVIEAYKN